MRRERMLRVVDFIAPDAQKLSQFREHLRMRPHDLDAFFERGVLRHDFTRDGCDEHPKQSALPLREGRGGWRGGLREQFEIRIDPFLIVDMKKAPAYTS